METERAATDTPKDLEAAVARAAALLKLGEVVALPTETVYGLAADALRPDAVVKIFEAKERPFFDPLIVHLPGMDWLERITKIPSESRALVDALIARFWPGPLTLVLPRQPLVPDLVTSGLETVAVRMSAHPVFRAVIQSFGKPLAAPSANRFGRISPTVAAHVVTELGGRIPLVVDGGPTTHGLESTIVAVEGTKLRLLRAGPVTAEDLAGLWKEVCERRGERPSEAEVSAFFAALGLSFSAMLRGDSKVHIESPGQLASHYAPRTPMKILGAGAHLRGVPGMKVGWLGWNKEGDEGPYAASEILSLRGDLREAAATLFAKLRRLDEAGLDLILAEPVPETGLGVAIMDRLRKAAAPR